MREERNLLGVLRSGVGGTRPVHRMAYNADNEHDSDLDIVLPDVLDDMAALRAEGHRLLMHCPGGLADGLVLRAWLMTPSPWTSGHRGFTYWPTWWTAGLARRACR